MSAPRVETVSGTIEGEIVALPDRSPIYRFLGIPYGASPEGARRWQRPASAPAWAGVRRAVAFGPAAPQRPGLPTALPAFRPDTMSEDCLTLNVWSPGLDGRRPVMVWIHGGAFTAGSSSQPVYDGARLAAEADVVVVTINYRLGALGFLCPDDAEPGTETVGNAGLHDQLAALRWVAQHATALGGDPSRFTAFGESAGAGSILHLLASTVGPAVTRAAAQSGEPRTLTREEAARVSSRLAAALHLDRAGADSLRPVPTAALLAAQEQVTIELFADTVFPSITDRPYQLSLGAYGFYWFRLQPPGGGSAS